MVGQHVADGALTPRFRGGRLKFNIRSQLHIAVGDSREMAAFFLALHTDVMQRVFAAVEPACALVRDYMCNSLWSGKVPKSLKARVKAYDRARTHASLVETLRVAFGSEFETVWLDAAKQRVAKIDSVGHTHHTAHTHTHVCTHIRFNSAVATRP